MHGACDVSIHIVLKATQRESSIINSEKRAELPWMGF